jgi:hypothetical protein
MSPSVSMACRFSFGAIVTVVVVSSATYVVIATTSRVVNGLTKLVAVAVSTGVV